MPAAPIAVLDRIFNACPALAAIVLDLFNRQGLDVVHKLIFPKDRACHWAICALSAQALSAWNVV